MIDATGDSIGVNIDARDGNDTITDCTGAGTIGDGTSDDTMFGSAGDDSFEGGDGKDVIMGGNRPDSPGIPGDAVVAVLMGAMFLRRI